MNTVLLDSSFWIGMARQKRDPIAVLSSATNRRELAICGTVRCEVARGVRNEATLARLRRFWDVMIYVPTDNAVWLEVEDLLHKLDRSGQQIPLADAVIACCAKRIGAAVFTFDGHFNTVPGLKVISDPSFL